MPLFKSVLIANRGEIAIRIARAASELGLRTVSLFSEDDVNSLHRQVTTDSLALAGTGASAYLDIGQVLECAKRGNCDAIHPGYGFLSENADFAARCVSAALTFIGPSPEILRLFGDKVQARKLARSLEIPTPPGIDQAVTLEDASAFMKANVPQGASLMVKALAGGGGRGMRRVERPEDLPAAFERCRSEAVAAFGRGDLYVEQVISDARHIEVQVLGDGKTVVELGDRDCSIQRRHQKIVEIAPSPELPSEIRAGIAAAATRLAESVRYQNIGTFEFLVRGDKFWFIEANPRLQVEHTVTEEVTGVDLVKTQFHLAMGASIAELGLADTKTRQPRGYAIQLRINMEPGAEQGAAASGNSLRVFDIPSGPGIRVDTFGYTGFKPSTNFDPLLAKLIVHSPSSRFADAVERAYRALCEFRIMGLQTNIALLQNVLLHPDFRSSEATTRFVDSHFVEQTAPLVVHPRLFFADEAQAATVSDKLDAPADASSEPGCVTAPVAGSLLELSVAVGQVVHQGQQVAVIEAMKMEHVVTADCGGTVREIVMRKGDSPKKGVPLLYLDVDAGASSLVQSGESERVAHRSNANLEEVQARHAFTSDAARPSAVDKRHRGDQRTARENLDDLCDPGSFIEYGSLAVAAQRSSRSMDDLRVISPADGFIYGTATVNGALFGESKGQCLVASYDYMVFAGTQGHISKLKHDRMFKLAESTKLPIVVFTEGAGGRPNDSDRSDSVNLAHPTFWLFAKLSGLVPLVAIVSGRCFAGNVALAGCCDVVIATQNATMGMAGPVMIEGAGLGTVKPEDIGPSRMQAQQGVVDILVRDEAEAVRCAKRYLSYFQGAVSEWNCPDQQALREVIPERRTRVYEIRTVIELLADTDSVLELRSAFGAGLVTAFMRIEGHPIGVVANNPMHQGGALGSDEADKYARFVQLCDAFDIPILSLCDTPGIMVGVEAEKTGLVRHAARMLLAGANISVPFFIIMVRKAYGLGALAMSGGCAHSAFFAVAWPSAEFGGMGLEGQVKWGNRDELAAISDPVARQARYQELVDALYEKGKAVNVATFLSIDDVIDPAESRRWIASGLRSAARRPPRSGKKRPYVDAW